MLIELFIALFAGIIIGTITGLTPGIHINLVSAFVLVLSGSLLLNFQPIILAVFLVSMATAHIFLDFIPSIFLGAPDEEDNALSILPGHEMLIKGEAHSAVIYSLYGCLFGLIIILLLSPVFYFTLPIIYPYVQRIMPFILILTSIFLIYFEKSSKIIAFIIFISAGLLGIASFNLPIKESLLPLFTGLFGVSSLITSLSKKQKIPKQEIKKLKEITLKRSSIAKTLFASLISSPLCSFLPGMGSGQAAIIGSEVTGDLDRKEFLVLLGSIATIVTGLSFITFYSIGKARTGIAVAVSKIIELNLTNLIIITATIILSGIFSFFIAIQISKIFSKFIKRVNYRFLSAIILVFITIICFIFTGFLGLLLLIVSALLGLACILLGVRRTHLMGSLLIPTILLNLL